MPARREELLAKYRDLARTTDTVPGIREFLRVTGEKKHLWDGDLWPSWSTFLADAGFAPNQMTAARPDEDFLRPLAEMTKQLGRFPTVRERKYAGRDAAIPSDKAYRNRFKGQADVIARLLEWIAEKPEFESVEPLLRSDATRPASATPKGGTLADPKIVPGALSDCFVPPVVDCLATLAAGTQSVLDECAARGVEPSVEFEKRVAIALGMLGLHVESLGQGAGRVADGIASCRAERWAVVYDAKLRRDGFSMGTEDRKFLEYVERHGRELEREGTQTVYFAVISSRFSAPDVERAREIVRSSKAKAVVLLEAAALRAAVELQLRKRSFDDRTILQQLFDITRIVGVGEIHDLGESGARKRKP